MRGGLMSMFNNKLLSFINIKPDDVIIYKFNTEEEDLDEVSKTYHALLAIFPDNKIVGIPNRNDLMSSSKTEYISFLKNELVALGESVL